MGVALWGWRFGGGALSFCGHGRRCVRGVVPRACLVPLMLSWARSCWCSCCCRPRRCCCSCDCYRRRAAAASAAAAAAAVYAATAAAAGQGLTLLVWCAADHGVQDQRRQAPQGGVPDPRGPGLELEQQPAPCCHHVAAGPHPRQAPGSRDTDCAAVLGPRPGEGWVGSGGVWWGAGCV